MKRLIIAISLVLAVFCLACGQANQQTQATADSAFAEQELIQAEKEWNDAILKRDVGAINQIAADDSMSMGPEGDLGTKAEMIANLTTGESTLTSLVVDDIKARALGDAGVTWSLTTQKDELEGKETISQYRHISTWVKRAGRWQLFAGTSVEVVNE